MSESKITESIAFLAQFLTAKREKRIDEVLAWRTRRIVVILEDIYNAQNASAVLRSCECLGIQDIYIIENNHQYVLNPDVVKGADKWLRLLKYPRKDRSSDQEKSNTYKCLNDLKAKGYRIVAADPAGATSPDQVSINQPLALVFGSESVGLSDEARQLADELVSIPMYGFTGSYNLSVSVALLLQNLSGRIRSSDVSWQLSGTEHNNLKLEWYKNNIRNADNVLTQNNKGSG